MDNESQVRRSPRFASLPEMPLLQEEGRSMSYELAKAQQLDPVRLLPSNVIIYWQLTVSAGEC